MATTPSKKIFASPGRFVINRGELANLATYIKPFGEIAILVAHHDDVERVKASLEKVKAQGITLIEANFGGECTQEEISRIMSIAAKAGANVSIGLGGGKAIDTAKCVANFSAMPLVVVPTIASTDAPCSALAVVYDQNHVVLECHFFPRNPDVVVVDSQTIAEAPPRFLAAGIADAYATYFEARACLASGADNFVGGTATAAGAALASLSRDILLLDGEKAMAACRKKIVTPALESVIEANLLLSGLGFESVGLAAAHALHDALTSVPDTHQAVHGEKVAIGVLVQHMLENETIAQLQETFRFFKRIGLPTTLAEIGIVDDVDQKLRVIAERAAGAKSTIHNMPFKVSADMVFAALKAVDTIEELLISACDCSVTHNGPTK